MYCRTICHCVRAIWKPANSVRAAHYCLTINVIFSWKMHFMPRLILIVLKVKVPPLRATKALRVGRGIALSNLRPRHWKWGWVVNATPRPLYSPGKDPVPIVQEAGWGPGPVWTGAENLAPPGFDPRALQSVASRYTDWAIPAAKLIVLIKINIALNYNFKFKGHWEACTVLSQIFFKEVRGIPSHKIITEKPT